MLSWKVGNGLQVYVGIEPFLGGEHFYLRLSDQILAYLQGFNIHFLAQIKRNDYDGLSSSYWLLVDDLGVASLMDIEQNRYILGLHQLDIQLVDIKDLLIWDWNKSDGDITANQIILFYSRDLWKHEDISGIIKYGSGMPHKN